MFRLIQRRRDPRPLSASLERHQISPPTAAALTQFLIEAGDHQLYHCNPHALAEVIGQDERTTLRVLLVALQEGLVTLNWDVRCPACATIIPWGESLASLHAAEECPACGNRFAPHLDTDVHITFSVHERIRRLGQRADDVAYRAAVDTRMGIVSGHTLLLLPEFQQLFPKQRLLPNESLQISRVAILFTDLAGSTALYAQRGDPRAYHLVRLHFDELFRVANAHGGMIIKTIGDAVMAAFQTPGEAMRAAQAMLHAISALNERAHLHGDEQLILKVGVHVGPGLSVTLNDRHDYFGTIVNLAARVQRLARGDDIVFTQAVRDDDEMCQLLAQDEVQTNHVALKGIAEPVHVFHWTIISRSFRLAIHSYP